MDYTRATLVVSAALTGSVALLYAVVRLETWMSAPPTPVPVDVTEA